jgi:hypothetical protein
MHIRDAIYQVLALASEQAPMQPPAIVNAVQELLPDAQRISVMSILTSEFQGKGLSRKLVAVVMGTSRRQRVFGYWLTDHAKAPAGDLSASDLFGDSEGEPRTPPQQITDDEDAPDRSVNSAALPFVIRASNLGLIAGVDVIANANGTPTEVVIRLAGSVAAEDRAVHDALKSERDAIAIENARLRLRVAQLTTAVDSLQPLAEQATRLANAAKQISERG